MAAAAGSPASALTHALGARPRSPALGASIASTTPAVGTRSGRDENP